jgi:hypothetical protein
MISFARQANLQFQKNLERRQKLYNLINKRREKIAHTLGVNIPKYSRILFDDPLLVKLVLTSHYWSRIEKRSIKTMNIDWRASDFHEPNHPLRDDVFLKVINHFAKHNIKMKIKYSNNDQYYKISLTTLGLD